MSARQSIHRRHKYGHRTRRQILEEIEWMNEQSRQPEPKYQPNDVVLLPSGFTWTIKSSRHIPGKGWSYVGRKTHGRASYREHELQPRPEPKYQEGDAVLLPNGKTWTVGSALYIPGSGWSYPDTERKSGRLSYREDQLQPLPSKDDAPASEPVTATAQPPKTDVPPLRKLNYKIGRTLRDANQNAVQAAKDAGRKAARLYYDTTVDGKPAKKIVRILIESGTNTGLCLGHKGVYRVASGELVETSPLTQMKGEQFATGPIKKPAAQPTKLKYTPPPKRGNKTRPQPAKPDGRPPLKLKKPQAQPQPKPEPLLKSAQQQWQESINTMAEQAAKAGQDCALLNGQFHFVNLSAPPPAFLWSKQLPPLLMAPKPRGNVNRATTPAVIYLGPPT